MKVFILLLLVISCNSLVIEADKQYACYHVNATFGEPIGERNVTGRIVVVDPIIACGDIKSNLTNSIALLMKQYTSDCHPALQVSNVQKRGAIGAIVMNFYEPFFDDYQIVDDEKKDDYNITIPVAGILYQNGNAIQSLIMEFKNVNATINREFEYQPFSIWEYLQMFLYMILLMWGSYFVLYTFLKLSDWIKLWRRSAYVRQIKTKRFHMKESDVEEKPTCTICLCEYEEGDVVKFLRCGHSFHSDCIDPWLINKKALCPICRRGIYMIEDWNLLEENQSREIDIILTRYENQNSRTFSNLFSSLCCCGFIIIPLILFYV